MNIKEQYDTMILSQTQQAVVTRKKLHITQEEMAFRCGVSLRTIMNFENYKYVKHPNAYLAGLYNYYFKNYATSKNN